MPLAHRDVVFSFALTPVLALRAPLGVWPRTARGVSVAVGEDRHVTVTSVDRAVAFATRQVLDAAAQFLRAIAADAPLTRLRGELSTPHTGARPLVYSIALGARVSITRVLVEEEPTLLAEAPRLALVGGR